MQTTPQDNGTHKLTVSSTSSPQKTTEISATIPSDLLTQTLSAIATTLSSAPTTLSSTTTKSTNKIASTIASQLTTTPKPSSSKTSSSLLPWFVTSVAQSVLQQSNSSTKTKTLTTTIRQALKGDTTAQQLLNETLNRIVKSTTTTTATDTQEVDTQAVIDAINKLLLPQPNQGEASDTAAAPISMLTVIAACALAIACCKKYQDKKRATRNNAGIHVLDEVIIAGEQQDKGAGVGLEVGPSNVQSTSAKTALELALAEAAAGAQATPAGMPAGAQATPAERRVVAL